MKLLRFLSASMLLTALNTPVFAEKEAEVAKEDEAVSSVEVDDAKSTEVATETTEAKNEDAPEVAVDEVTDFNAGLANLVGNIMADEQFAHEEAEEEGAEKNDSESESESDEKVVAKNEDSKKDSKE